MSRGSVAAVVVSYNTRGLLVACLKSLLAARARSELAEIVVLDSGSADGSAEAARGLLGHEWVVEVPNRGYGAAVNAGIEATSADYVLALNADTTVCPGAVATLARRLDGNPWTGIVGPRLLRPDGSAQPSRRRFPTRLTPLFESTIVEEWWPRNRWARRYRMEDSPEVGEEEVDWLVGAALMARRAAIEQAGGFDPAFRMYSEEVEWQWRLRRRGWRVEYVPGAEITHNEGSSTGQNVPRRQLDFDRSKVRLAERMHGRRYAALVRRALMFGYAVALGREALKWALGNRRDLRRERIAMYRWLLGTGLRDREGAA